MKKKIVEIAKDLNLSPSTISKIVNNKGRISEETRKRVLAYVEQSAYVAMSNARILSSKKSHTIGVIYSDISLIGFEHPFFSLIFQAFKRYVEKRGYDIVMIVSKLGKHELTYLEWCRIKKVDGILIVMGNINNPNIKEVVASSFPCVSTDIVMDNLHTVISNDYQGVSLAIDHAQKLKFTKIAMLTGPQTGRSFYDRAEAFKNEMKKRGLSYIDEYIMVAEGFGYSSGFNAGVSLVENTNVLPEIILVFSDVLAFGLIRGLNSLGIEVPNDISVIGYDDIDFSVHFEPSLTTIRQNTTLIGERAAEELINSIENNLPKQKKVIHIPVELIERNSTKK